MTTSPIRPGHRQAVAAEIRAHLARRRIRGIDLEPIFGISQSALSRKINGDTAWKMSEIKKLAALLDMTPRQMLGDVLGDVDEVRHLAELLDVSPAQVAERLLGGDGMRTTGKEYADTFRLAAPGVLPVGPADNRPIGRPLTAVGPPVSGKGARPVRLPRELAG